MFNLLNASLYKARKSITVRVLFLISIVSSIIMLSFAYAIGNEKIDANAGNIAFLFSDMNMLTLLGAILAAHLIGSEFESRTMHHLVSSGYSRLQIIISRLVSYWIVLVVMILPFIIVSLFGILAETEFSLGSMAPGFLSILTATGELSFGKGFMLFIAMTFVYLGQLALAALIALIVKKAIFIIAIYYAISALTGQLAGLSDSLKVITTIVNLTPFGTDYIVMHPATSTATIIQAIVVSLLFMTLVTVIAFLHFRKADIK